MNERIKKLAFSSGLVRNGDQGMKRWEGPRSDSINDQDLQLFAELIVTECIRKIENEAEQYAAPTWAFELVNDIKETFGVDE